MKICPQCEETEIMQGEGICLDCVKDNQVNNHPYIGQRAYEPSCMFCGGAAKDHEWNN